MVFEGLGGGEPTRWRRRGIPGQTLKTSKTNQTPLGLGPGCLGKGRYRGLGLGCLDCNPYTAVANINMDHNKEWPFVSQTPVILVPAVVDRMLESSGLANISVETFPSVAMDCEGNEVSGNNQILKIGFRQ